MSSDECIRQVLAKYPRINLAVLFGSLANHSETVYSDIDLAIGADGSLSADEKMQLIMELAEATGRPVDLVDLSTVGEPLLGQIITRGRRIIGTDSRFAALVCKHLFDQADFMPYRSRILEERRKAWIGL